MLVQSDRSPISDFLIKILNIPAQVVIGAVAFFSVATHAQPLPSSIANRPESGSVSMSRPPTELSNVAKYCPDSLVVKEKNLDNNVVYNATYHLEGNTCIVERSVPGLPPQRSESIFGAIFNYPLHNSSDINDHFSAVLFYGHSSESFQIGFQNHGSTPHLAVTLTASGTKPWKLDDVSYKSIQIICTDFTSKGAVDLPMTFVELPDGRVFLAETSTPTPDSIWAVRRVIGIESYHNKNH